MQPNSLTRISGERAACLEVLIREWEGRRKPRNPCLYLYLCFHICMYKNMCSHTQRKQNKTEQSIAHGPPPGRGRENKQAADVNHVTASNAGVRSDPVVTRWCKNPPEQEAAGDPRGRRRPPRQRGPRGAGAPAALLPWYHPKVGKCLWMSWYQDGL